MDFFEQQAQARKKTGYLYMLMALAVATLIAISCIVVAWTIQLGEPVTHPVWKFWLIIPERLLALIVGGILFVIVSASGFEYLKLRSGGAAVAEALGGKLIPQNTTHFGEKRILNIVEEMAIASGVPVPPVYLLDDEGINAFAAGHSINNAVIGITRGCLTKLSRDELQGVIAHEFSHIFHGDMKINMRLAALLFGILFIALIGEYMMRASRHSSSNARNPLPFIGLALFILGYCGVFFANLIKAAVSRQREFLADASAVQYTRNPDGIGGALFKILQHGSQLAHPNASQFSHMYFANGIRRFSSLFATHPPLELRLDRIKPNGRFTTGAGAQSQTAGQHSAASDLPYSGFAESDSKVQPAPSNSPISNVFPIGGAAVNAITAHSVVAAKHAEQAIKEVGSTTPEHLQYASELIASFPEAVTRAIHDPYQARGLILGLFIEKEAKLAQEQWASLPDTLLINEREALFEFAELACNLTAPYRLPLVEMTIPTLKQLPQALSDELIQTMDWLIRFDHKTTLDEWCLSNIIKTQLQPSSSTARRQPDLNDIGLLISTLVQLGHSDAPSVQLAFDAATEGLAIALTERRDLSLNKLDASLNALVHLPIMKKLALLKRLSIAAAHDKKIHYREAELIRAIAARLECPMPPLIIRQ